MIRTLKALALAAVTTAGALGATAAQASAANFQVFFAVQNADASNSMIRTSSLPATITGLINPAASILPSAFDPGSGHAVYSDALPALGSPKSVTLQYDEFGAVGTAPCTFTVKVAKDTNVLPYLVHFTSDNARCSVPADVRSSDGQFTAQTFILTWSSQ